MNKLYEMYQGEHFSPTYRTDNNCNLENHIRNWLDVRHQGDLDIYEAAEKLSDDLCCKDCSKCNL